ncbi:S1/P1 nuclease [Fibrivirga algicola]|uniref:S1/P1 nuclease n=1 Tax=Fibrivirga algicola TaxID=2950420 RepID=A0ABX0QED3_9BACT|nr:S1/P1 nuclease [Fibrivirga algicola]NID09208.1 S1/P1 nuclease [Fibrivirga algicola]
MNRISSIYLAACFLLATAAYTPTFAWNKATHMATGAIAYQEMQASSPKELARVVAILRQHPEYQQRWASKLNDASLSEDDRNLYLFMLAARWADDVRGNAYDHPTWHYINYVYAPKEGIARTDTTLATGETILQAFEQNKQVLRSNAPDSAKAIALCWLFHLTGDVHQPLHATALVDSQFPTGDRGGNLFKIKVMMSSQTINLHSFWDGMLLGEDDFQSARNLAVLARQTVSRDRLPQLGKTDVASWSKESFQLAQDNAYRSNTLTAGTDQEGTVLPADYVATVKPIAQRQVALAGYRLADELTADLSR